MTVSLKTRVLCNLLLYIGLSYIVYLFIGSLTYSLIISLNVLVLHVFICEVSGDCKLMRTREYVSHMLAIAALIFGIELGLVVLFSNQSIYWLLVSLVLIKGGIEYELKDAKI